MARRNPDKYTSIVSVISQIASIEAALEAFCADIGRYPTTGEGLRALIACPTGIPAVKWKGPYLYRVRAEIPRDAWGREIRYSYPAAHARRGEWSAYDLVSAGEDGVYGTRDDITNHSLREGVTRARRNLNVCLAAAA